MKKIYIALIITLIILGAIYKFVPGFRGMIILVVSISILVYILKDKLGDTLILGLGLLGSLGIIFSIIMGINKFPNPDRTPEQLIPCTLVQASLGVAKNLDWCLKATTEDFYVLIDENTEKWQENGALVDWTPQQYIALIPAGNVNQLDHNAFSQVRAQYGYALEQYLAMNKWELNVSLITIGFVLSLITGVLAYFVSKTELAPLAKLAFPLLVGLLFMLGRSGFYFPLLGVLPTQVELVPITKALFMNGFWIHAGTTIFTLVASMLKGTAKNTRYEWLFVLVLDSILVLPLLAVVGNSLVNEAVISNLWLSNTTATNSLYMGYLFSFAMVAAVISFLPKKSDDQAPASD